MRKYCVDCKHFDHLNYWFGHCKIPQEAISYNPVYGRTVSKTTRVCKIEREEQWGPHEDHCGLSGRYFEPKEEDDGDSVNTGRQRANNHDSRRV